MKRWNIYIYIYIYILYRVSNETNYFKLLWAIYKVPCTQQLKIFYKPASLRCWDNIKFLLWKIDFWVKTSFQSYFYDSFLSRDFVFCNGVDIKKVVKMNSFLLRRELFYFSESLTSRLRFPQYPYRLLIIVYKSFK